MASVGALSGCTLQERLGGCGLLNALGRSAPSTAVSFVGGTLAGPGNAPEAELLLCAAQACAGLSDKDCFVTLAEQGIDWDHLLRAAFRHGMLPILHQILVDTCPAAVPSAFLDQLRANFRSHARRTFILTGKLLKCLRLFDAQGIPAMPYRGPVLATAAYGDLYARQFDDLDVLVPEQQVLQARDLLVSRGYRPLLDLPPAQEAAYFRAQAEHTLVCDADAEVIELHWRIAERYFSFPLDPQGLWERRSQVLLAGKKVWTFSPEDLLLTLCVHGTKHLWRRLLWICDVARLLCAYPSMNWPWLMGKARALGSERMLRLGLFLANELLGAPLPVNVEQDARADPAVAFLATRVRSWLFVDPEQQLGTLGSIAFHLKARERRQDRIRYCLRLALTTTVGDWDLVRLPSPLFPLYYLLRPIRLVGRYGRELLGRLV